MDFSVEKNSIKMEGKLYDKESKMGFSENRNLMKNYFCESATMFAYKNIVFIPIIINTNNVFNFKDDNVRFEKLFDGPFEPEILRSPPFDNLLEMLIKMFLNIKEVSSQQEIDGNLYLCERDNIYKYIEKTCIEIYNWQEEAVVEAFDLFFIVFDKFLMKNFLSLD